MTTDPLWPALSLLNLRVGRTVVALILGVLTLVSAITLAVLSAWLITRAWQMPPVLDLSVAVVSVRALGISRGLFRYLERLYSHDCALSGVSAAREQLYTRLAAAEPAVTTSYRRGELVTRMGADIDALGDVVIRAILPMLVAFVTSVAVVLVMYVLLPFSALILAVSLIFAGVFAPWLAAQGTRRSEQAGAQWQAQYDLAVVTALDHTAELRVAGQLENALNNAATAKNQKIVETENAAKLMSWAAVAHPLAIAVSLAASLVIGVLTFTEPGAQMSPMTLAMAVLLPLAAFESTTLLPDAAITLTRAQIAAKRIMDLVHKIPLDGESNLDIRPKIVESTPEIVASGLSCGWHTLTNPVSFSLPPGSRTVITGASGVGKTALLMTIAGLLPEASGTVTVNGTHIRDLTEDEQAALPNSVGFFAEDAHIFDTTVRDNLLVACGDASDDRLIAALTAVGLQDWLNNLPEGLNTRLVLGAQAVSGGQRRRLLLARVIISPARVLLLDEPTEHLSAEDSEQLLAALLDRHSGLIAEDRTVVVVTHHLPGKTKEDQRCELTNQYSGQAELKDAGPTAHQR
ncbi:MAG: thiol reductant ABC exporter subunit CydC [Mycobacteriaceae bacterium]